VLIAHLLAACQFAVEETSVAPGADDDPGASDGTGDVADLPEAVDLADAEEEGLTGDAREALGLVPTWMRADVELSFRKLKDDDQDAVAGALLGESNPLLWDEIGFAIAHLPWETLKSRNFDPQILVENAEQIYAVDSFLDYVEVVEVGTPGEGDWYTTTSYKVEQDGAVVDRTLERDLYYWWIVHPRMEDEHPWYVDAWAECSSGTLECRAAREEGGTYWRSFLWSTATERCPEGDTCPVLRDSLPGVPVLWGAADGNDAVHAIARFMLSSPGGSRWLNFGAYGERSIQPNRIYALGRGNCGEWADMTTALSRTALIPTANATPSSWDHTWNSSWVDRWFAWEPVNWWFDHAYGSGYATYITRGDTTIALQSDLYTTTSTVEFQVVDASGWPVDGASVIVYSPYDDWWWYAGEQATDLDGVARFVLGADKEYIYQVMYADGDDVAFSNSAYATRGTPAGETTVVGVSLPVAIAERASPMEAEAVEHPGAVVSVAVTAAGRLAADSARFGEEGSLDVAAPVLETWVLRADDYEAMVAGDSFAVLAGSEIDPSEDWVVVLANLDARATSALVSADISVAPMGDAFAGTATHHVERALLPGEHLAVRIPAIE
jgi:hypothetical protein